MVNKEWITASEIGEYVFCKRGWWLRVNGYLEKNDAMVAGTAQHDKIAWSVIAKKKIKRFAIILIISSAVLLVGIIVWQLFMS